MIEPKNEVIDGMKFYFQPLPAITALKLDKKIISLIVPALGGLEGMSLDADIDMKTITQGIGDALGSLQDEETERLILELLSSTLYIPDDGKNTPQEITRDRFNLIFTGKLRTVYKLVFAVMKYNKFSPFELVVGGNVMKTMFTSVKESEKGKKTGKESVKSEGLLGN